MKARALVPLQDFRRAKSRLASVLDDTARARFAEAVARHVVTTLRASADIVDVTVVSPSDAVCAWALELGASAQRDADYATGLAQVIDAAARALGDDVLPRVIVMGDLPALGAADLAEIARAGSDADVVVATDLDGLGTNALWLARAAMPTCFGNVDSAARHVAQARALGLRVATVKPEGVARDVDLPEHLAYARALGVSVGA